MPPLTKQVLDVRLLGLDEKADPKTSVFGVIESMNNCIFHKDGRIEKRLGLDAVDMLDSNGNTIAGREIASHGDDLLLSDGKHLYTRDSSTGKWISRGQVAYERLDLQQICSSGAACDGRDSALQVDSASIGNRTLVLRAGGWTTADAKWSVIDNTNGTVLAGGDWDWANVRASHDGMPTDGLVAFGVRPGQFSATAGALWIGYWKAAEGFQSIHYGSNGLITDIAITKDQNTYTTNHGGPLDCASFEVIHVAAGQWLIAYVQFDGAAWNLLVRSINRTVDTFSVSAPATVYQSYTQRNYAMAIGWAEGANNTRWLVFYDQARKELYCKQIAFDASSITEVSSGYSVTDSTFADCQCRGLTGQASAVGPIWLVDVVYTGGDVPRRKIYQWMAQVNTMSVALYDCGLATKAFSMPTMTTGEMGVGIALPSAWQPSLFMWRWRYANYSSNIGAHLAPGDYAGTPGYLQLPSADSGRCLFGKLTNPVGRTGTATVIMATALNQAASTSAGSFPTQGPPAEHAGSVYWPGGNLQQYDGQTIAEAAFPLGPDLLSAVADTAAPTMEVGTREYTALIRWQDKQGRIHRSQPTPPVAITTTTAKQLKVTVSMVRLTDRSATYIELYRTAVDQDVYYKVAQWANDPSGDDVVYSDYAPDSTIVGNEQLYTTGGSLENWPPGAANVVVSHAGRLFLIDAEGAVRFSGYANFGEGVAFSDEYMLDTTQARSRPSSLLSLDDKLIIGASDTTLYLAGIGPEANGTPVYDSPSLLSVELGPTNQRGCVRIPDGIVMITSHGAYLLNRGLSFQFIGQSVTDQTIGVGGFYAGVYEMDANQARLFGPSKTTLVWDWTLPAPPTRLGQWMPWNYVVDVIGTAQAGGAVYYLGAAGAVYTADSGYDDAGTGYQQCFEFSLISPAGVNAWQRVYAMRFGGQIVRDCVFQIVMEPEEGLVGSTQTHTFTAAADGPLRTIAKPRYGKSSSFTLWVGESAASTKAGFVLDAIGIVTGAKGGVGRLPIANRMTRAT